MTPKLLVGVVVNPLLMAGYVVVNACVGALNWALDARCARCRTRHAPEQLTVVDGTWDQGALCQRCLANTH